MNNVQSKYGQINRNEMQVHCIMFLNIEWLKGDIYDIAISICN